MAQETQTVDLMKSVEQIKNVATNAEFMAILRLIESADMGIIQNIAKGRWFEHGLDRFEIEFVNPCLKTSEKEEPPLAEPEGLTMTWGLLFKHLHWDFLGAVRIAKCHIRVCEMLQRLIDGTQNKFQQFWEQRLSEVIQIDAPKK